MYLPKATQIIAINKNPTNNNPTMVCEIINDGSEFNVSVEGKPPKYAARKMTINTVPTPWAANKKV